MLGGGLRRNPSPDPRSKAALQLVPRGNFHQNRRGVLNVMTRIGGRSCQLSGKRPGRQAKKLKAASLCLRLNKRGRQRRCVAASSTFSSASFFRLLPLGLLLVSCWCLFGFSFLASFWYLFHFLFCDPHFWVLGFLFAFLLLSFCILFWHSFSVSFFGLLFRFPLVSFLVFGFRLPV